MDEVASSRLLDKHPDDWLLDVEAPHDGSGVR
jgi:hypothetical protein